MKRLNAKKEKLFAGDKVTIGNTVYWLNPVTREVYAHSVDEEILGSISGYKVADVDDDGNIIKCD